MWLSLFTSGIGLAVPAAFATWILMLAVHGMVYKIVILFLSLIIVSNVFAKVCLAIFTHHDSSY